MFSYLKFGSSTRVQKFLQFRPCLAPPAKWVCIQYESSLFRFSTVIKTDSLSILQWLVNFMNSNQDTTTAATGKLSMKENKNKLFVGWNSDNANVNDSLVGVAQEMVWDYLPSLITGYLM